MGVEHGHVVDKYGGSEWSGVDQVYDIAWKRQVTVWIRGSVRVIRLMVAPERAMSLKGNTVI
jgi:hypothetical protein